MEYIRLVDEAVFCQWAIMERQPSPNPIQQPALAQERKVWGKLHMEALWRGAINEQSGFVAVPVSLLRLQSHLTLSATDMLVVINLLAHRWGGGTGVFPRNNVIAKRMGVAERSVQRSIQRLIGLKLVTREKDAMGRRVLYLEPLADLVAKLTPMTLSARESIDT